jgi:hypothetical protein
MGLVLELIDISIFVLFGLFVATQLIVPLVAGKPLFPLLRGSGKSKAEKRLASAQKRIEEARALKEAAEKEVEAAKLEVEAARLRTEALHTQLQGESEVLNEDGIHGKEKSHE